MKKSLSDAAVVLAVCTLAVGCDYKSSFDLRSSASADSRGGGLTQRFPSSADVAKSPIVRIESPNEGEVIYEDVYQNMEITGIDLPGQKTLVTFLTDAFDNVFLIYPLPRRRGAEDIYVQKNVRINTEGNEWQLHATLADTKAVSYLKACAKRGKFTFDDLPSGVELAHSVSVERRKR